MCDITSIQITGENRDANGVPTQYILSFRLQGCEAVDIEMRSSQTGQVIYQGTAIQPTGTADANGYRLVTQTISPSQTQRKPCNDTYYVSIRCRHLPDCKHEGAISISCKVDLPPPPTPCSNTTILAVRNSQGAEVNLGNPCLPPDTYTIEVISPWSAGSIAQWSVLPTPAGGGSTTATVIPNQNGRQVNCVLPDNLQPAGTGRTILASVVDMSLTPICISTGGAPLPPPRPTACPTSIRLELRSASGQLMAPTPAGSTTYANLAAGTYTLTVTSPVASPVASDVTYDFFGAGNSALASGPANSYQVTIGATNSPREIDIFVRSGECCPVLRATVTLSVATSGNPPGGTNPDDDPPPPPTPEPPPSSLNICAFFRIMLALSLTVLLTALLFVICVSVVTPVAAAVAVIAAISAGVFLALSLTICRLNLCGFLGVLLWALRWAVVVGVIVAVLLFFLLPLFLPVLLCVLLLALIYGIVAGILTIVMQRIGCPIPNFFSWP
jgi:hypothetical protein